MIKSKLINIDKLSAWFGGSATVRYNKSRMEYRIIIKNDDLIDEFVFWFTEVQYLKYGEREILVLMLDKYLKSMEIEQRLIQRGLM
mgnify:CR=1 FL=1